jgi:hypothetical protein
VVGDDGMLYETSFFEENETNAVSAQIMVSNDDEREA